MLPVSHRLTYKPINHSTQNKMQKNKMLGLWIGRSHNPSMLTRDNRAEKLTDRLTYRMLDTDRKYEDRKTTNLFMVFSTSFLGNLSPGKRPSATRLAERCPDRRKIMSTEMKLLTRA